MSKGPKGPRNPMGWGNDDPRVIKRSGRSAWSSGAHTMHGSTNEWSLMSGTGRLIRWSGGRVNVTGEKPGRGRR